MEAAQGSGEHLPPPPDEPFEGVEGQEHSSNVPSGRISMGAETAEVLNARPSERARPEEMRRTVGFLLLV